ncbi:hypothetical protein SBV1_590025 [Verrucomicrobia bacterium]|nr:hypothetical protein SBV1_590025 [Verrucomicrobiota bacterium]
MGNSLKPGALVEKRQFKEDLEQPKLIGGLFGTRRALGEILELLEVGDDGSPLEGVGPRTELGFKPGEKIVGALVEKPVQMANDI